MVYYCNFILCLTVVICLSCEQEKNRVNKDGEIVISSTKTRSQQLISAHCLFTFVTYNNI